MIAWLAWLLLAPLVYLADGWLAAQVPLRVDLGAAVCAVVALRVRTAALPGALLAAAIGKALLEDGSLALHCVAMGLPTALLLPLRAVFEQRSRLVLAVAVAFLTFAVPRVTQTFAELSGQAAAPLPAGAGAVVVALLVGPLLGAAIVRLSPLGLMLEDA